MFKQYQLRNYRIKLVILVYIVTILGIMVIGSAETGYQSTQLLGLALGSVLMIVCSLTDYNFILNFSWLIYLVNIIMLVLLKTPLGKEVNGATRWLNIFGFQFQPSELSKILVVLFFSRFLSDHSEIVSSPKNIILSLGLLSVPLLLIKSQPDLSTTIVIALVFCTLFFAAGLSYKFIGSLIAVVAPAALVFINMIMPADQTILEEYQWKRIMAWLKPAEYADNAYQQQNSIMAIGSGQLSGKGLHTDAVASVKNGNFLAEPQTDFIFAVAGEELGFIGCAAIIILLLLIIIEIIMIGRNAKDLAGNLICCGVAAWIGFQSFINICVATGLMPNTGVPLPFVSYGLTSLATLYIAVGIVLNVGLQPRKY
ncbi:MAG: FtsW/RodA/SpoVE family cell cycle protein [Lachnospiraceae bacterium]